jgi:hypothetical protein
MLQAGRQAGRPRQSCFRLYHSQNMVTMFVKFRALSLYHLQHWSPERPSTNLSPSLSATLSICPFQSSLPPCHPLFRPLFLSRALSLFISLSRSLPSSRSLRSPCVFSLFSWCRTQLMCKWVVHLTSDVSGSERPGPCRPQRRQSNTTKQIRYNLESGAVCTEMIQSNLFSPTSH